MKIAFYESSLTDVQWAFLRPMLPKPSKLGRPPIDRRHIIDALLYVTKGGIQWRLLPADFPSWKTVYHIFRQWTLNHTWEALNARLRAHVRILEGKRCRPTAAILDSQSVKSAGHTGPVGYDAAKRIKGRKRHLLVDTLGLILGVHVTPANVTEREGAQGLLERTLAWFAWLRLLWVDGGYCGPGLASIKRTENREHLVNCFGVRSQRVKSSPGRYGCAGDCRRFQCSQRSGSELHGEC